MLLVQHHIADVLELVGLLHPHQPLTHLLQLGWRLEVHAPRRVLALLREQLRERLRDLFVAQALLHLVEEAEIVVQLAHVLRQRCAFKLRAALAIADHHAIGGALHHHAAHTRGRP